MNPLHIPVFGWMNVSERRREQGPGHSLVVGYRKQGSTPSQTRFNVIDVEGTASMFVDGSSSHPCQELFDYHMYHCKKEFNSIGLPQLHMVFVPQQLL